MRCVGADPTGHHCCTFNGDDCEFLTYEDDQPRCTLYPQWGSLADLPEWRAAPVGEWFADRHPGYECKDWPQNVPLPAGKPRCCWDRIS